MISETDLNLYSFTSTATIFGPNKSVICIFIEIGNDSNLLIVFYVQIMPDDLVMQLHRF